MGPVQSDPVGWGQALQSRGCCGSVEIVGVEVTELSVSRQSRTGKDLFYFSVVGSVAAMK